MDFNLSGQHRQGAGRNIIARKISGCSLVMPAPPSLGSDTLDSCEIAEKGACRVGSRWWRQLLLVAVISRVNADVDFIHIRKFGDNPEKLLLLRLLGIALL